MKNKSNIFAKSTIILLVFILFFSALTAFTESATLNEVTSGTGNATGDRFGWNVSYAGDLNGDGYDDIVVGAPYVAAGGTERGAVYIFFGYSGINTSNINAANANVTISGATNNAHFGWSLGHGKVNEATGGIDDIIIGEPDNGNGKAYIFFGRSSWSASYTTANANVILTVGVSGDKFGSSVSGAGDVNNDGYDDIIIGAYANSPNKGKAYIYYGKSGGLWGVEPTYTEVTENWNIIGTTTNFDNMRSWIDSGANATMTEERKIVFESWSISTPAAGTSFTVDKPTGTVDGNLLIAIMSTDGVRTLTAPAGWTVIVDSLSSGASTFGIWWKIASSEPAIYTFTVSASETCVLSILRFSGHDSSSPIDVYATATGASTTPTCPTITTTVSNAWVLRTFGADDPDITTDSGYPAGHTGIFVRSSATPGATSAGAAYTIQGTPGATGPASFTMTASEQWAAATIAIKPAQALVIQTNTTSVPSGNSVLQIMAETSGEQFNVNVWNGSNWNQRLTITATTMTLVEYTLTSSEVISGVVRVRYTDNDRSGSDTSTDNLWIDYQRIKTIVGPNVTLTGENANDKFGFSVSGAGNVNGDSYDDVIVGAPGYDNNRGRAYVVYGGSSLASNYGVETIIFSENFEGDGSPTYAELGWTMEQYGSADSGNAFNWKLVKGADIKLTNHGSWQSECGSDASVTIDTGLSSPVINCAGYNKVVVEFWSSYKDYTDKTEYGAVNISIDGGTSWAYSILLYESDGTTSTTTETRTVDISSYAAGQSNVKLRWRYKGTYDYYWDIDDVYVNGTAEPDVTLTGGSANDNFGYSVSGLGDINGDGVDDFAVGAPGYDNSKGRAYVYYGSNNLLSCVLTIQQQNDVKDACIFSDSATTNTGSLSEFYVGYCTDAGYLKERALIQFDLGNIPTDANIVKANMKLYLRNSGGIDTTFQIPAYRVTPLDTNEWTESGITWNTYDGTNNWETAGLGSGTDYVSTPVASTSVDTAVTWYTWDIKQVMQGWVDEIYPNRGLVLLNTTIEGNAANDDKWFFSSEYTDYYYRPKLEIEYVYANVTLTGAQTGDKFGYSVSGGNITRDSYNDIVIGAPYNDTAGSNAGAIYIFNGSASMPSSIPALNANYTNYGENPNDNFGFSVSYAGDVNNDNYDDIIAGAPGYEINRGKVYVFTVVVLINNPPEITNLGVQGYMDGQSGLGNITNHTPKLNWTYSDPNGDFQGGYNVTVWNVTIIMWYINSSGIDNNVTYGVGGSSPLPLADGFDYNFTVKVNDSEGAWSTLAYLVFHMNSIPPIPDPKEPSNNSVQTEAPTITVSWNPVTDVEGSPITYLCRVYKPSFPNLDNETYTGNTFFEFSVSLGTYEWRVQANDSYENSSWSETWSFTVVSGNVAPTCDNPAVDGFYADTSKILNITSDNPLFNFTYNDNNGDNMYRRNFTVYTSSWTLIWYNNTTESVTPGYDVNVTYAGPALVDGQDYYLNVTCNDTNTTSLWSNVVSVKFHMNTPPNAPTLVSPANETDLPVSTTQTVSWNTVTDNEGSPMAYWWQVSTTDATFTSVDYQSNTTGTTSSSFATSAGNTYYWRVKANDSYEEGVWSGYRWFMATVIVGNTAPTCDYVAVDGFYSGTSGILNITSNNPVFNFTYNDNNGDNMYRRNFTVYTSSWTLIWYNNTTESVTPGYDVNVTYAGSTLVDGNDYYLNVTCNDTRSGDDNLWSTVVSILFFMNTPPSPPILISPGNNTWLNDNTPLFNWSFSDQDGDESRAYNITISSSKEFTSIDYWVNRTTTSNITQHEWGSGGESSSPISDGAWYWKVKTFDGYEWSEWSGWNITKIDTTNPSISSLKPSNNELIRNKTVNISAAINDALSGINWSAIMMKIDGSAAGFNYNTETGAIWNESTRSDAHHTVYINAKDYANNTATIEWGFVVDSTPLAGYPDTITFSHYLGMVGQTITIYVTVYNSGLNPVVWYVNITANYGELSYNESISIDSKNWSSTSANYIIPSEADGKTITFTVRIYDGSEIDSQTAEFKVASSFTGAAPVKSFDPSLSMIFIAAIFAALLSLKCKHKRRKQK